MTNKEKVKLSLSNFIVTVLDEGEKLMNVRSLQQYTLYDLNKMYQVKAQERIEILKQKKKFYNSLRYLKQAKLVTEQYKNGEKVYGLSKKGRLKSLTNKISSYEENKGQERFFHIVIFDIPERNRHIRTLLRKSLYNLGYERVQKSCFISNDKFAYDLTKMIVEESNLSDYVNFFALKNKI